MGAVVVSVTRGASPEAPALIWVFAALLIPLSLACGNVYRTLAWPKGASPDILAFWCHMVAVMTFIILLLVRNQQSEVDIFYGLANVPWAASLQFIAAGIMFPIFFRLQNIGGPVLLSQIGYVAAAVGLLSSTVFLGEEYGLFTWVGALVIAAGIAVTIVAQNSNKRDLSNSLN